MSTSSITLTTADDTYTSAAGDYAIDALDGNNTITTGAGSSTVFAGDGNDTITTGAGDNIVNAGAGNNTITTGAGNSMVTTGDGNDTITTGAGSGSVSAGAGNNTITTGAGNFSVISSNGDDTITTGAGDDMIYSGSGSDIVNSAAGNDVLIYDVAENMSGVPNGISTYVGGSGVDTLRLSLTRAEWMSSALQGDIANYLAFLSANTGPAGEANATAFTFSKFGLTASLFEKLEVTVDGVFIEPANHAVSLGDDTLSISENMTSAALNVLGNDAVPDLIQSLTNTNPTHGSVQLMPDYSNTATSPVAMFVYKPNNAFYDYLAVGERSSDVFTYTVTDATGDVKTATVNVTITGINDAPVITSSVQTSSVSEGNNQPLGSMTGTGTISYSDVDLSDTHSLSIGTAAAYGNATVDAVGNWTYTALDAGAVNALAAGEHLGDSFTVLINDGHGGLVSELVPVIITGTNDVASIAGLANGSVQVNGVLVANGALTISDVDTGEAVFVASSGLAGMFGSFTFTNGVWTYTLNNNAANVQALGADNTVHDTLLVQSKDGTASQEINVLITGESNGISATNTQGFESGTFNGWNVLGSAEVVTEHDAFLPANGNYFAVLNGNGASAASMESFLGLSPGKLNSLGNGAATSGSVIKTTVNLSAGDVLSFDWAFQAHDYLPFDDFSFLVTGAGQILELADVKNTGNYGFSGWHNFKYTANANTVFELGIGATNVLDNALDSHLLIDNFFII